MEKLHDNLPDNLSRVLIEFDVPTNKWVASCLDLKFSVISQTLENVSEMIFQGIDVHRRFAKRRNIKPFQGASYPPFPTNYENEYEQGTALKTTLIRGFVFVLRVAQAYSSDPQRIHSAA